MTVRVPWTNRRFELERAVRSRRVVVLDVLEQHAPKVALVQRDDVVGALPTQRPDQALSDRVRAGHENPVRRYAAQS